MKTEKLFEFFRSKIFAGIIIGLFSLALLAGSFSFGVLVGYQKAKFLSNWGENYQRNFGGPRGGFFGGFEPGDIIDGHGVFGQIIKIENGAVVIKGRDNIEKIVLVDSNTSIRKLREPITINDLKMNDMIVVIGEPNDSGQTVAKFIRHMPATPTPGMARPETPIWLK